MLTPNLVASQASLSVERNQLSFSNRNPENQPVTESALQDAATGNASLLQQATASIERRSGGTALFAAATGEVQGATNEAMEMMKKELAIILSHMGLNPEEAEEMANRLTQAGQDGFNGDRSAQQNGTVAAISGARLQVEMRGLNVEINNAEGRVTASLQSLSISAGVQSLIVVDEMDPLILDLNDNGIETSAVGVSAAFDLDGDGDTELTGWVAGGDALLALDRNGNGTIDNGKELFGDQHGAATGFLELAKFDSNADGAIDANDSVYGDLELLFADGSRQKLSEAGIVRLNLDMIQQVDVDLAGGRLAETAEFLREDGRKGTVGEVFFDVTA